MGDLYRIKNFNAISLSDGFPSTTVPNQNALANRHVKLNVRKDLDEQTKDGTAFVGQIDNLQTTQLTLGMYKPNGQFELSTALEPPVPTNDDVQVLGVNKSNGKVIPVSVVQQITDVNHYNIITIDDDPDNHLTAENQDTLNLRGGNNVTLATNPNDDTITIHAAGGGGIPSKSYSTIYADDSNVTAENPDQTLNIKGSNTDFISTTADNSTTPDSLMIDFKGIKVIGAGHPPNSPLHSVKALSVEFTKLGTLPTGVSLTQNTIDGGERSATFTLNIQPDEFNSGGGGGTTLALENDDDTPGLTHVGITYKKSNVFNNFPSFLPGPGDSTIDEKLGTCRFVNVVLQDKTYMIPAYPVVGDDEDPPPTPKTLIGFTSQEEEIQKNSPLQVPDSVDFIADPIDFRTPPTINYTYSS